MVNPTILYTIQMNNISASSTFTWKDGGFVHSLVAMSAHIEEEA